MLFTPTVVIGKKLSGWNNFSIFHVFVTLVLALFLFLLMVTLANPAAFIEFFGSFSDFNFLVFVQLFLYSVYHSFETPLAFALSVFIALLLSLNLVIFIFTKDWQKLFKQPLGILGVVSGIIGVGCAACGTFFSAFLLSFLGGTFVLVTLPYQSLFFQLLGIFLLLIGLWLNVRKIQNKDSSCKFCVVGETHSQHSN